MDVWQSKHYTCACSENSPTNPRATFYDGALKPRPKTHTEHSICKSPPCYVQDGQIGADEMPMNRRAEAVGRSDRVAQEDHVLAA